jgi:hypothetical protein
MRHANKTIKAAGVKHMVSKNKKGEIVVTHPTIDNGRYDKINLTKKANAKTIKEGVKATRKYHKDNPYHKK